MRVCTKCKIEKDINDFPVRANTKTGRYVYCKECSKHISKVTSRTRSGVVTKIYSQQKKSSIKRGHLPPSYSRQELYDYILGHDSFEVLYSNWVNSGYDKDLTPSIDRKNDNLHYSFSNIRLVTWRENYLQAADDARNGNSQSKYNPVKKVLQFDKSGNFIDSYISCQEASRQSNISQGNISNVCKNKRKSAGGYTWKYQE